MRSPPCQDEPDRRLLQVRFGPETVHAEVVGHDDALEAHIAPEEVRDEYLALRGDVVRVDLGIGDVGHHDSVHPRRHGLSEGVELIPFQLL